jgi:cell division septation protein DedD
VPIAQGAAPPAAPPRSQVARTEERPAPLATAPAAAASTGGYGVQVTSQRSEAEAQAAFRELKGKYPDQIGNRQPIIRRADLGDKGTFYRALVGPFGSREQAIQMCTTLKAAGGSCIVQGI